MISGSVLAEIMEKREEFDPELHAQRVPLRLDAFGIEARGKVECMHLITYAS